ncbi:MAG: TolC family protein [Gemmatimonadota bacterium]|nr:TolC family protein [Gemmatimonadota bacterium]
MNRGGATMGGTRILNGGLALGCCLLVLVSGVTAQTRAEHLTLEDAIELARANNPTFLSTENDRDVASWREREAYGAFLPRVDASGSAAYTKAGTQRIGTLDFGAQGTDWYSSSYNLGLTWTLSGNTIFGVSNARSTRRATEARVDAAEFDLQSRVALQYMAALRARDQVEVAQRQLDRARQNRRIVESRVFSGDAAGTEGTQAEVDLGRAEVGLIQAQRDLRQAKLLLAEQIGVGLDPDVRLVDDFEVFEPTYDVEELVASAVSGHPSLDAFRAQESARRAAARQTATSQYLPTVRVSTGFRGNTLQALNEDFLLESAEDRIQSRREECEFENAVSSGLSSPLPGYPRDCSEHVMTEEMRHEVIASNDVFPFDFTELPFELRLNVSIPVFTGFSRQRQVAQARVDAEDAEHDRRAEELRLRTAVTSAADDLESAYRVLETEERNRALAEEQLQLQQRRYALGAANLLELLDAQTTVTTADQAYLNALYDFHFSLVSLEAAVGRRLPRE